MRAEGYGAHAPFERLTVLRADDEGGFDHAWHGLNQRFTLQQRENSLCRKHEPCDFWDDWAREGEDGGDRVKGEDEGGQIASPT